MPRIAYFYRADGSEKLVRYSARIPTMIPDTEVVYGEYKAGDVCYFGSFGKGWAHAVEDADQQAVILREMTRNECILRGVPFAKH